MLQKPLDVFDAEAHHWNGKRQRANAVSVPDQEHRVYRRKWLKDTISRFLFSGRPKPAQTVAELRSNAGHLNPASRKWASSPWKGCLIPQESL